MKNNFNVALAISKIDEAFVSNLICQRYGGKVVETCNDKRFDYRIAFGNIIETYEQKTDSNCVPGRILNGKKIPGTDTGNMAIETISYGKPSGVVQTEAPNFVYYYKYLNQVWIVPTQHIIDLIQQHDLWFGLMGEDGTDTWGFLLPRHLIQNSVIIEGF